MRFLMMVMPKDYAAAPRDFMPDPKQVEQMNQYNESLKKAGVLLDLNGLFPPSTATRVVYSGGKHKVVDGPFAEAREAIGGYWMIQVKTKEEAVEWASRIPFLDDTTVELRQIHEMADFPAKVRDAAKRNAGGE